MNGYWYLRMINEEDVYERPMVDCRHCIYKYTWKCFICRLKRWFSEIANFSNDQSSWIQSKFA